jgi:glycosyltransferase involved in cell wall biosynthesis
MTEQKKYKILMLSDHALSTSGVGCQSRFLIEGLIKKGCWSVRQFGAALKHNDYDVVQIEPDFIIKPIDGFGDPNMLRLALATEKPDVLFIFTDPRFFTWLWDMEDEIHQICPIAYWHVWDNGPTPQFNSAYYGSTDLINCHSYLTYEMVKESFPERTNFIPHALPKQIFHPLPENQKAAWREKILGFDNKDVFTAFWVNRNAKRKRPADVLWSWKLFLDKLPNRNDAMLLMHTDPFDMEGPNLVEVAKMLGIIDRVTFSRERIEFEQMNVLHNIADCCINISFAEGFGLGTLEAMQTGTPIIAAKTGGLTRQVIDHRDGTENGVAIDITQKVLVGSQNVPYIYEDYVSVEDTADAIFKVYSMSSDERAILSKKVEDYVSSEFALESTVEMWHQSLFKLVEEWKTGKTVVNRFEIREL